MKSKIILSLPLFSSLVWGSFSYAADNALTMQIDIPRMNVAEYHKPYVAVWLEDSSRKATQVALWYDLDMQDNEGKKWLKDIRQWWRRVGRKSALPFDGLTSATKGPGMHTLAIDLDAEHLADLAAGDYQLRIEASREVGGKEVLNIPLSWPPTASEYPLEAKGKSELGHIIVQFK
ncbi:DUF2271 domain-containing protein [Paraglaciecola aquimarina]|uniref:DUF2271 domain-containing protein n=1 Tax=Paraglaciecola aquimarina TaxID=1235557 RepID=A0ABU3SZA5_9ALTE|nr:DUF2271 domain-containing protein [Paraglaciecola aquimarina]MDU0355328.1 DUF2271 domain-containing protein [Paraglaciecola aquimarina]